MDITLVNYCYKQFFFLNVVLFFCVCYSVIMTLMSTSGGRCCLVLMSSISFLSLLICLLTPCDDIQVSVSKARTIIVLAEDGNADQV